MMQLYDLKNKRKKTKKKKYEQLFQEMSIWTTTALHIGLFFFGVKNTSIPTITFLDIK